VAEQRISTAGQLAGGGMMNPEQFRSATTLNDPYTGQQVPGMEISGQQSQAFEQIPEEMEVAGYSTQGKPYLRRKKTLSDAEGKTLNNAEQMGIQIADLKEIIKEDLDKGFGRMLQKAQFPGIGNLTTQGQRYRLIRKDLSDRIIRMRPGAQINEQEAKRLNHLLPKIFRRESVDLEQLGKFEVEFNKVQERLTRGRSYVGGSKQAQQPNSGVTSSGLKYTIEP